MSDLTTLHNPDIQKKVMDSVLRGAPTLFLIMTNNPGEWRSTAVKKTVKYKNSGQGGAFNGLMEFDTQKINTKVQMQFDPRWEYQPINLDQGEIDQNKSDPDAVADLVKLALEEATSEMGERLGSRIFGVGGADPVSGAPMIEGLRALVDDGTDAANIGGLPRSTYTTLKSPFLDVNAALSSSNDENINTYYMNATVGMESPDLFVTDRTNWNLYSQLVTLVQNADVPSVQRGYATRTGNVMTAEALGVNVGFESIFIFGRPLIADQQCPAAYFFGLNRKHLRWFGLKSTEEGARAITMGSGTEMEGPYQGMNSKNIGLFVREMMKSDRQYGSKTQLILGGSLTCFSPRHHFKLLYS